MFLTLLFYFVLMMVCFDKNKNRAIVSVSILVGLYLGIRYDYMYDYWAYYDYFTIESKLPYGQTAHMELGWYYLNNLFHPVGFFSFVFFTSCVFAYGVYLILKDYAISKYLTIIVLGFVTTSSFSVLSSAQRQMLVTGIFLIAYHFLLKGKISLLKDLFRKTTLLYYAVVILCGYLHSSSYFLLIVPVLFLIPKKSTLVSLLMIVLFLGEIVVGDSIIPKLMVKFVEESNSYEYLLNIDRDNDTISLLGKLSYVVQIIIVVYVYIRGELTKEQQVCVMLYYITILLFMSINYSFQIYRLGFYINIFSYISIGIFLYIIKNKNIKSLVAFYYVILCVQNALFIFNIQPGTVEEYKTIFSIFV